jgi:hypothetical protein
MFTDHTWKGFIQCTEGQSKTTVNTKGSCRHPVKQFIFFWTRLYQICDEATFGIPVVECSPQLHYPLGFRREVYEQSVELEMSRNVLCGGSRSRMRPAFCVGKLEILLEVQTFCRTSEALVIRLTKSTERSSWEYTSPSTREVNPFI